VPIEGRLRKRQSRTKKNNFSSLAHVHELTAVLASLSFVLY